MKTTAKRILSVLIALSLIATMVSGGLVNIARADSENLLSNSGFEEFAEGSFANWTFWGGNNGNTQLSQVDGRTNKAAKITVDNNNNIVNLYQSVTLEADKEYVLTAWVKTEDIALMWGGANAVQLSVSDGNGLGSITASASVKETADWQKLEITVNGSDYTGYTDGIFFDIRAEYLTGSIYIDDVSLTVKEEAPEENDQENLLLNGDLEEYSAGSFTNWTFWGGNNGNTQLSQVDGRTNKAAKITVDNNNNIVNLYQSVTLEADKQYVLSAWVKTEDIALMWGGANAVQLSVSDGNGLGSITASASVKETADWQKLEITVNGSDYTGYTDGIFFDIRAEYLTGSIYIDDVSLTVKTDCDTSSDSSSSDDSSSDDSSSDDSSSDSSSSEESSSDDSSSDSSSSEGSSSDNSSSDDTSSDTGSDDDNQGQEGFANGDFEAFANGTFTKWNLWPGNQGNTKLEKGEGRTGNAAKITVDNNNNIVNLFQSVSLEADKQYVLSAWVKTENLALQWDGANGVYLALSYNNNIVLAKSDSVKTDSDWTKLELIADGSLLKGNEWGVQLDVITEYLTGTVYVDDASITETTEQPDTPSLDDGQQGESQPEEEDTAPLKNSGFESFKNGNFTSWTFWGGNKGNTKLEQANGRTGKAAKFVIDSDENIVRLYQEVKLDPTLEYTFSVWVKTENTALQWATAPGVYVNLALDNQKVLASEAVNKDGDWTKISVVINGAVLSGKEWSVCFDVAAEFIKGDIYIDDATLEVTGKATPIAKPDEDELLKNNSFEIFSAGNFANWTTWKGNKGNTKFEQVNGRTGKGVKITVDDNNNVVNLYQEVKLDPTKEYTFSVWVKTEDIDLQWAGAQGVYLNFKYNNTVILMSKPVAVDSDWTKLELKVNGGILKGDEWGVSLDIAAEYLTGVVYVDDASVKVTGEGTAVPDPDPEEKLYNSGFELYSGYNFARWSLNKGNNGNTLLSQVKGKSGSCAKIVVDDNNNIVSLYQGVTLDPTKEYTFSVWVKTEDIALQWAGAEGIYLALGYNNLTPTRSKAIKADSDWTMLEVKVGGGDIPADAWGIQFAIMSEYLTGTIYIDDASMRITGDYVPRPDSFLENGGFDTPDEDTVIAGWNAYAEDLFSVLDRNTEKTYNSSPASASILNADNKAISYWEQTLENLDVTKTYMLSGYIFSDMIVSEEGGAAVYVEFYDPEGNLIRTYRTSFVKGEQTDWNAFEMKLAFPENCVKMIVKAALVKAVGTAYFDEFSLAEYDETTDTAEEGIKDNMYALETEDEDTPADTDKAGIPVYVWFIIGGAVVLVAAAIVVAVVLIRKKKKAKALNL